MKPELDKALREVLVNTAGVVVNMVGAVQDLSWGAQIAVDGVRKRNPGNKKLSYEGPIHEFATKAAKKLKTPERKSVRETGIIESATGVIVLGVTTAAFLTAGVVVDLSRRLENHSGQNLGRRR